MLCIVCKKNTATVHITVIEGSESRKSDLCEECASKQGLAGKEGGAMPSDALGGKSKAGRQPASGGRSCKDCRHTYQEFKKTGRLGCPRCYSEFEDILEPAFRTMHRGVRHRGKVPARHRDEDRLLGAIRDCQEQLEEAVGREDYEQAARLRDEIKRIRGQLSDPGRIQEQP